MRRHFCHLHTYLPARLLLRDTSQISYISYLFLLRRLWTAPIFKSRDDGTDMRFRSSWAARHLNQGLRNVLMHFYSSYIETGELKASFLAIFNLPKYLVAVLSMVEGVFSLLFYCESGINQFAWQITLKLVCYYLNSVGLETMYCHSIWEWFLVLLWEASYSFALDNLWKRAHF